MSCIYNQTAVFSTQEMLLYTIAESVHSASGTEVKTADLEDTEEILDQG